jgi:hypothetical protein
MDRKKLLAGTTVDILPLAEAASLAPSATMDPRTQRGLIPPAKRGGSGRDLCRRDERGCRYRAETAERKRMERRNDG